LDSAEAGGGGRLSVRAAWCGGHSCMRVIFISTIRGWTFTTGMAV
jgi:hypothetical protein